MNNNVTKKNAEKLKLYLAKQEAAKKQPVTTKKKNDAK